MSNMSLQEAMAIAVLKGDLAGAYALADKLVEDRDALGLTKQEQVEELGIGRPYVGNIHAVGYEVYHWPEFEALMRRLGIMWASYNIDTTIRLTRGEIIIERTDLGRDMDGMIVPGT